MSLDLLPVKLSTNAMNAVKFFIISRRFNLNYSCISVLNKLYAVIKMDSENITLCNYVNRKYVNGEHYALHIYVLSSITQPNYEYCNNFMSKLMN